MRTLVLDRERAASAERIQSAIDQVAAEGGRVVLPEMELTLDRGLELRSGTELVGQGQGTVLRKGPGRVYPLTGYHNYGMRDVPLQNTTGLAVGMTVNIHDNLRRGFYETVARITWIDGHWVGLDTGLNADYAQAEAPRLKTAYSVVFGHGVRDVAVRDLVIEGNADAQDEGMGGCRGGAVFFLQSAGIEVSGIHERDYAGEGLSFQMCRDVTVRDCSFDGNTGNGLHPGSGSTNALIANCRGAVNRACGFFFCVRANHITVRDCEFDRNRMGMSVGTRDCHNLIEGCTFRGNTGPGIQFRTAPKPCEVHSCRVRGCRIEANATAEVGAQVDVQSDAHDLLFERNRISGSPEIPGIGTGILVAPTPGRICAVDNTFEHCTREVAAEPGQLVDQPPAFECGYGVAQAARFKHLAGYAQ